MSKLSKFSVKYPITVLMGVLVIVLLGYISYDKLGIDLFPNLNTPRIFIEVTSGEKPPGEMESEFVEQIESQAIRQSEVVQVASVSATGVAQITVEYAWNKDMDEAFLDLQKALTSISQSDDIDELTITQHDPNVAPVMVIGLEHSSITDMNELRKVAENYIRNEMVRLPGVADIELAGQEDAQVQISTDNYKLHSYNLTLSTIESKISSFNQSLSGGKIVEEGTSYVVKGVGLLENVEDFEEIIVGYETVREDDEEAEQAPIYLGDVATVEMVNTDPENIVRLNGKRCIGLSVYKETSYNTVKTVEAVNEELARMENDLSGYHFTVISNQGGFIQEAIDEVKDTAVMGILLAIVVLFVFLRRMGTTFIVSISIPVSIIATFNLMYSQGLTLNIMTLGGLALGAGMLVDNAIVVMENIFRNHEQGMSAEDAAVEGTGQVIGAITASTITTIVVFLPIIYLQGASGELFREQAWTVAFSLIASLVVAVFLIPMLYSKIYKGKTAHRKPKAVEDQKEHFVWYANLLRRILGYKYVVILCSIFAMAGASLLVPYIGSEFMPESETREFSMHLTMPEGTRLERTSNAVATFEELIAEILGDDLKNIYSQVGPSSGSSGDAEAIFEGENTASIKIILDPESVIPSENVTSSIAKMMEANPEVEVSFEDDQSALSTILGTDIAPVVVEIKGEELDEITRLTELVKSELVALNGLYNVQTSIENGAPELEVEVDRFKAGIYGMDVSDVVNQISSYLQGQDAGTVDIKGELRTINLKLPDVSLEDLRGIELDNNGAIVRLDEVATLNLARAPKQIDRRNQVRIGSVEAQMNDDLILDKMIKEVRAKLDGIEFPTDYSYEITGEEKQRADSMASLQFALILSVLLVYMVMASQFESLIHPFTILLTIPLSVVGAVLIFFIVGKPLNIMAIIGVIMLVGIAVNDSIILVDRINQLKRTDLTLREAIVRAGQQRIRPIIMTTLTTILALLPLTFGFGQSASLRSPMAMAVIGGLVTSTLLSLVVIPCVYEVFEFKKKS